MSRPRIILPQNKSHPSPARAKSPAPRPWGVWLCGAAVWLVLISGVLPWSATPGIWQALQLKSLLEHKRQNLIRIENEIAELEREKKLLEGHRPTQEREIRRVLGYAAPDEIVFDFSRQKDGG